MTDTYEAKRHYQKPEIAKSYNAQRFRGLRGRLVNQLEQRLLLRSIEGLHLGLLVQRENEGLPSGALVLDLPAGTGRIGHWLRDAGYRTVGADISLPMMLEGRTADAPLVRGEAERLPFADNSLDAAVCFRLMSHLPPETRVAALREMARVARQRVVAVYQPHRIALWWFVYGLLLRRNLPRYYPANLDREFVASGVRVVRSHSLLRGVLMERAYVLARD